jgi:hypothetical protein
MKLIFYEIKKKDIKGGSIFSHISQNDYEIANPVLKQYCL